MRYVAKVRRTRVSRVPKERPKPQVGCDAMDYRSKMIIFFFGNKINPLERRALGSRCVDRNNVKGRT